MGRAYRIGHRIGWWIGALAAAAAFVALVWLAIRGAMFLLWGT